VVSDKVIDGCVLLESRNFAAPETAQLGQRNDN
jgi:hypothetical protein